LGTQVQVSGLNIFSSNVLASQIRDNISRGLVGLVNSAFDGLLSDLNTEGYHDLLRGLSDFSVACDGDEGREGVVLGLDVEEGSEAEEGKAENVKLLH